MKKILIMLMIAVMVSSNVFGAITIKDGAEEVAMREKVYVETTTVEQVEEFTIARLDRQIDRCDREIAEQTARKEALEAKKASALAVK